MLKVFQTCLIIDNAALGSPWRGNSTLWGHNMKATHQTLLFRKVIVGVNDRKHHSPECMKRCAYSVSRQDPPRHSHGKTRYSYLDHNQSRDSCGRGTLQPAVLSWLHQRSFGVQLSDSICLQHLVSSWTWWCLPLSVCPYWRSAQLSDQLEDVQIDSRLPTVLWNLRSFTSGWSVWRLFVCVK